MDRNYYYLIEILLFLINLIDHLLNTIDIDRDIIRLIKIMIIDCEIIEPVMIEFFQQKVDQVEDN